ncbi:hypothetical protein FOL47_004887, partial [Perkinsus chesapeaki]
AFISAEDDLNEVFKNDAGRTAVFVVKAAFYLLAMKAAEEAALDDNGPEITVRGNASYLSVDMLQWSLSDVASLLSSFFNWVAYSFHCEVVEVDVEEHKMVSRAPSTYCPMFIKFKINNSLSLFAPKKHAPVGLEEPLVELASFTSTHRYCPPNPSKLLSMQVPRDSFANAARCLSNSQWRNRVLPAFRAAAASCRSARWTELFGDRQTRLLPYVADEDVVESSGLSSCISDVESLEEIEVVSEKRKKMARWRQDYTTLSLSSDDSSSSSSRSREEILLSDDGDDEVVEVEEAPAPSRRGRKRAAGEVFEGGQTSRNRKKFKNAEFSGGRMSGKKRARQNQRQKRQNQRSY